MIQFLDAHGYSWRVTELPQAGLADVRGCLYFFSRGATRRLREYPRDWDALGWRELEELRERAEVLSTDPARAWPAARSGGRREVGA